MQLVVTHLQPRGMIFKNIQQTFLPQIDSRNDVIQLITDAYHHGPSNVPDYQRLNDAVTTTLDTLPSKRRPTAGWCDLHDTMILAESTAFRSPSEDFHMSRILHNESEPIFHDHDHAKMRTSTGRNFPLQYSAALLILWRPSLEKETKKEATLKEDTLIEPRARQMKTNMSISQWKCNSVQHGMSVVLDRWTLNKVSACSTHNFFGSIVCEKHAMSNLWRRKRRREN